MQRVRFSKAAPLLFDYTCDQCIWVIIDGQDGGMLKRQRATRTWHPDNKLLSCANAIILPAPLNRLKGKIRAAVRRS